MSTLAAADGLAEALARIASSLRTPVLILALLALLVCAVEAGRFAIELWSRARGGRGALRSLARRVIANPEQAVALSASAPSSFSRDALLEIARAALAGEQDGIEHALAIEHPLAIEHALADYELAVQRRLDHTRILVRAGPALGLMGTLIPLAPGLAALGRGEVGTLAADLRTAFAATTIGLLVGTVAFALTLTRTRMYSEDLTALERATILITAPPARTDTGQTRPIRTSQRAIPTPQRPVPTPQMPATQTPSPPTPPGIP